LFRITRATYGIAAETVGHVGEQLKGSAVLLKELVAAEATRVVTVVEEAAIAAKDSVLGAVGVKPAAAAARRATGAEVRERQPDAAFTGTSASVRLPVSPLVPEVVQSRAADIQPQLRVAEATEAARSAVPASAAPGGAGSANVPLSAAPAIVEPPFVPLAAAPSIVEPEATFPVAVPPAGNEPVSVTQAGSGSGGSHVSDLMASLDRAPY
jgi:hypothetical protein